MHGAEVRGFDEYEEIERVGTREISEMGVRAGKETPLYIVIEELKRQKLRVAAEKRAVRCDDRMNEREEYIARMLEREKPERQIRLWKGTGKYYEANGDACKEIERETNLRRFRLTQRGH